ncbi:MAG: TrmH family RNA methyltransferase [Nitriliruptorales bacterium]|nr:TrmH family RNA methyltransferase [Nitriliruptorales bacterium]
MQSPSKDPVATFSAARDDGDLVVLEGIHPWKHASRFGAAIVIAVTNDRERLTGLVAQLAPDLALDRVQDIDPETWDRLAQRDPTSPLLAVAERRRWTLDDIGGDGDVVVLDRPRHGGNVGAAIRAAAAADAAGVITLGGIDPWTSAAVRGAAGLQFALPVIRLDEGAPLPDLGRHSVGLDPAGPPLPTTTRGATTWVFGTERKGLADRLRIACDDVHSLPMRAGVSSLNLAVSVGVVLYLHRRAASR